MRKLLSVSLFLSAFVCATAQTVKTGNPVSWNANIALPATVLVMPPVDNEAEIAAEMLRRSSGMEKFMRFGHEESVHIDVRAEAERTLLPGGEVLSLLRLRSAGAVSINLVFSQFELAKGAHLFLYDKKKGRFIGAHTAQNNNAEKVLGTDLIYSDEIVIELTEPAEFAGTSSLVIGTVVHGYLNLDDEAAKALNSSQSCEYDVNCPAGAGWENQRNGTAMMVNTSGFCTGSLVHNTSGTIIPYFLTGNHCGSNPATWVFRFRWEAPAEEADCGTAAPSVNGPENMNINGGTRQANSALSDFLLILLNAAPDPAWDIYYSGWDRTGNMPAAAVGIHHPSGDIKKISFENDPLISTTFGSCPPGSHWGITDWDLGVTEGGSSGSPLFNTSHGKRIVGQLHGGSSSCSADQKADQYGKFSYSWEGEGTPATRLKDWLDPSGTNADFIDGVNPLSAPVSFDAGLDYLTGAAGVFCNTNTVSPVVELYNAGSATLTSALVTYSLDDQSPLTFNWTGSLAAYQNQSVALPSMTVPAGSHSFFAKVSLPNGNADQKAVNDTVRSYFTITMEPVYANLKLQIDCDGSEIGWRVTDAYQNILYSSPAYVNNPQGQLVNESFCFARECYTFTITDTYGDGLKGFSCNVNGSFYLTTAQGGDTLAKLLPANADFNYRLDSDFCLDENLSLGSLELTEWKIFPNPASGVLNIDLAKLGGVNTIQVINPAGQVMKAFTSSQLTETIDLNGFAKGIYFISLTSAGNVSTKTFIVQ